MADAHAEPTSVSLPQELQGVGVGRKRAVGPVVQIHGAPQVPAASAVVVDGLPLGQRAVRRRVEAAFETISQRLRAQAQDVEIDADNSVLTATAELAEDFALRAEVLSRISDGDPPVGAIDAVVGGFAVMFEQEGGYLAERVTSLHNVRDYLVAEVMGLPIPGVPDLKEPAIIVAREFSAADAAALDLSKVLAIVTELGGTTGHMAIMAGQLGLPCVVQAPRAAEIPDGTIVAVDAVSGLLTIEPDAALQDDFMRRTAVEVLLELDTAPGATSDGRRVALFANIGTLAEGHRVKQTSAEGVGLFRTESIFLERTTPPSVAEQRSIYASVLETFGSRPVVFRTLDSGADKPLAFSTYSDEENPALGVRGYRTSRANYPLLDAQFSALAQAQQETGQTAWVMAPMISTAAEAREFAEAARGHGLSRVGVMIEVPAAALRAHDILAEVDFVSLGTNDLAQYTMASDRLRGELSDLLDPWQPAILDLVSITAHAGLDLNKTVGLCGEAASDPLLALVFAGLGIKSLSMAASAVPAVKFSLRHHTSLDIEAIAQAAISASSAAEARAASLRLLNPSVRSTLGL